MCVTVCVGGGGGRERGEEEGGSISVSTRREKEREREGGGGGGVRICVDTSKYGYKQDRLMMRRPMDSTSNKIVISLNRYTDK